MILLHVLAYGFVITRATKVTNEDIWVRTATIGGAGICAFCFQMWFLGFFNGWYQATFIASSAVSAVIVFVLTRGRWRISIEATQALPPTTIERIQRLSYTLLVSTTVCLAAASCLRPTVQADEADYHWPAPMLWASTHHWLASPYRFMNGPCFVELCYLPSALFHQNLTAGHLTHFLFWLILLACGCALARLMEAPLLPVVVAAMACPTVTNQASVMMNDLGATTFVIASIVVLLASSKSQFKERHIILSAFIFCGAISSKQPFAAGVLPAMLAYIFFGIEAEKVKVKFFRVMLFILPCLVTELLWLVHTHSLTGNWIDLPMHAIWSGPTRAVDSIHPGRGSGLAGYPTLKKIGIVLVAPLMTWLLGNQEPFGGRTGLVVPIFLPAFLLMLRRQSAALKRFGWWLFGLSFFYYSTVGPFVIRTRYHMVVWVLWSVLAGIGFAFLKDRFDGKKKTLVIITFCVTALIGCADSWRNLSQWQAGSPRIIPQFNWLFSK